MFKSKMAVLLGALAISGVASADLSTGLVAHWNFDDCSAADITGHGYDGTLIGAPQCVNGNSGKALQFDGVKDYVDVGNKKLFSSGQSVTIVAWIKSQADLSNIYTSTIISKWTWPADPEFSFGFNYGNLLFAEGSALGCSSNCPNETSGKFSNIKGAWNLVGIRLSGNTVEYIKNGKIVDKDTNTYAFSDAGASILIASSAAGESLFKGMIDDLRVYDRALSNNEISELFAMDSRLQGSLAGTGKYTVTCTNTVTNQTVSLPAQTATAWDCSAAGLQLAPKQTYHIGIDGIAD